MYRFVVLLCLVSVPAFAALGPSSPPPGIASEAWKQMCGRADWVSKTVAAINSKANRGCVYAVVLELLGEIEASSSQDTSPLRDGPRSVSKGHVKSFKDALKKNSESECGGGGGGGAELANTVRGLLRFAAEEPEWDVANYEALKSNVVRAAQGMAALGVFGPAATHALPAAASVSVPVLNPSLFIPRKGNPNDGT